MFDEIIKRMAEFDTVMEARKYVMTIIHEIVKIKHSSILMYKNLLQQMVEPFKGKGKGDFRKEIDGLVKMAETKQRDEMFNQATDNKERDKFDTTPEGVIMATQDNMVRLLENNKYIEFSYDTFTEQELFRFIEKPLWHEGLAKDYLEIEYPIEHAITGMKKNRWYRTDGHSAELKLYLHKFFPEERSWHELPAAIEVVTKRNQFDLYMDWMDHGLPEWDGIDRMDFLARYAGVEDIVWAIIIGHSIMLTLVYRCYIPGYDVRGAPIFEGPENQGKSWLTRSFAFDERFATPFTFSKNGNEYEPARQLRGRVMIELADKGGMDNKTPDQVKAFLTQLHDTNRRMAANNVEDLKRRFGIIVTCNESGAYLKGDVDGDTRFEPVRLIGKINVEAIKLELPQLYAQAKYLYETGLVNPRLTEAEQIIQRKHVEPRQLKSDYYYWLLPILKLHRDEFKRDNDFKWDDGAELDEIVNWCAGEDWFPKEQKHNHKSEIVKTLKSHFKIVNTVRTKRINKEPISTRKYRYCGEIPWDNFIDSLE